MLSKSQDADPLFERTMGAFAWRFLSESSTFVLRLFVTIILARLLPVDAFGLLTLVMIVMNLAYRVSQIGMAPAIIQRKGLTGDACARCVHGINLEWHSDLCGYLGERANSGGNLSQ